MKQLFLLIAAFVTITASAQNNFTYTPQHPKAGDEIKFTYTPAGDLTGMMQIPEAFVMIAAMKGPEIIDITLQREYGALTGKIKTDTSARTVVFGFTKDDKFDNNQNNGYIIQLCGDDGKVKPMSYADVADVYSAYGEYQFGMKTDNERAINSYREMFKIYPDTKNDVAFVRYLNMVLTNDKEKGSAEIQKEIEKLLAAGLENESDYDRLSTMYTMLRFRQQSAFIKKLKDEKFPKTGKEPSINDFYEKYMKEPDLAKKENILAEVIQVSKTSKDSNQYKSFIGFLQNNIANAYVAKKDWDGFKKSAAQLSDESTKASLYNSVAWKLQGDSSELKTAEELSKYAVTFAKADRKNPKGEKPKMQRYSEWIKQKENNYATYADTYAMVLYRMGQYKQALPYTTEAVAINKKNADVNTTYALIAEKTLSPKKYKPQLEQFVKDGAANAEITGILKNLYIKEKGSDAGFGDYVAALEKEAFNKMLDDLKKNMLNDAAPQFALKDLSGNTVNISDLKGKVVIVDFWATWCGPCIASMPGMKKMVNQYKDNPNVKFLFIDTWQNEENEIDVVKKFIADKAYNEFHVLMDLDDKVVSSFKVSGIPTKFIIGKDGNIKFKEVGFDGEDNLLKKLPAMIELAD
jgi:thiol-disulfide isomerase/thioredoxin